VESTSDNGWDGFLSQRVHVKRDGKFVRTGYVEDITPAGDGVWLEGWGVDVRTLYTKAEGYSLIPVNEMKDGS
jgi:hypothetical protein